LGAGFATISSETRGIDHKLKAYLLFLFASTLRAGSAIAASTSATKPSDENVGRQRRLKDRPARAATRGGGVVFAICVVSSIVLAPVDLLAESTASAECRSAKPAAPREYWSWRQIDGRQCWYAGRPGRSKATLHWPAPVPAPQQAQPPQAPQAPQRETIGIGAARGMEPVIKPKPVTTFTIGPGSIERSMARPASFDERFAADRWSTNGIRTAPGDPSGGATGRQ
jgi:hypothetical protein